VKSISKELAGFYFPFIHCMPIACGTSSVSCVCVCVREREREREGVGGDLCFGMLCKVTLFCLFYSSILFDSYNFLPFVIFQ